MTTQPQYAWAELHQEDLRAYAAQYVGWATNDMSDPKDLQWEFKRLPLQTFSSVPTDWSKYYREENTENPRYDASFAKSEFHTPIIISIEDNEIIIWDGWHRLACAIHRKDKHVQAIVGQKNS